MWYLLGLGLDISPEVSRFFQGKLVVEILRSLISVVPMSYLFSISKRLVLSSSAMLPILLTPQMECSLLSSFWVGLWTGVGSAPKILKVVFGIGLVIGFGVWRYLSYTVTYLGEVVAGLGGL